MKTFILAIIPLFIIAVLPNVVADEAAWESPPNSLFKNIPVNDRIIPIGFSKKGVFSYILQQNSCQSIAEKNKKISLIAIDLVTDKVLDNLELGRELPDISSEDVIQKYLETISDHNKKYGTLTNYNKLTTIKTIKFENDELTADLDLIETVLGEDAINPGYRKYKVLLHSRIKGTKILAEIKSVYEPLHYWGHIKSPFEQRIAVLFISDFRGCDAFPQMRINIIGANLLTGFKPIIRK